MDNLLGSLSSTYDLTTSTASTNSITSKLSGDYSDATEDELLEACKEFEAYFVEQILKNVDTALVGEDEDSTSISQLKDYATDGLYQEYAKMITDRGSLGLAQELYEQMQRNYGL